MLNFSDRISGYSFLEDVAGQYLAPLFQAVGGRHYVFYPTISVMEGKGQAFLHQEERKLLQTALKVISYATVVLPLLALLARQISRLYSSRALQRIKLHSSKYTHENLSIAAHRDLPYLQPKSPGQQGTIRIGITEERTKEISYPAPRIEGEIGQRNQALIDRRVNGISDPRAKELLQRGFDAVEVLSFEDLYEGFKVCLNKFLQLSQDEQVTVASIPEKSSEWMMQMAIEQGAERVFEQVTTYAMDTAPFRWEYLDLCLSSGRIVIFDDVMYSGSQIQNALRALQRELTLTKQTCHVTVVVPFASERAIRAVQAVAEQETSPVKVTLITTDRRIPATSDVFSLEEMIFLHGGPKGDQIQYSSGLDAFFNSCLATMAWKRPDSTSFPQTFSFIGSDYNQRTNRYDTQEYPFGNPKPPYKHT